MTTLTLETTAFLPATLVGTCNTMLFYICLALFSYPPVLLLALNFNDRSARFY